jgi:pilus assembly protein FimV
LYIDMSTFHNFFPLVYRSFLLLLLAPSVGLAVGFGNLSINSNLGEELHLEVDLISVTPAEIGTMTVELASRSDYARANISYPEISEFLVFEVAEADGNFMVVITSATAITESFLHLLISAKWSGGKVIREYTALLDPPLYSGESAAVVEVAGSDESNEPVISSEIAATTGSLGSSSATSPEATDSMMTASTVTVMRGDTLSGIVNSLNRPASVSLMQGLTAILDANPDAFIDGNMNRLIAGASLKIPDFGDMAQVNNQNALQNFRSQVDEYNQYLTGIGYRNPDDDTKELVPETESAGDQTDTGQTVTASTSADAVGDSAAEETVQSDINVEEVDVSLEAEQQDDVLLSIGQDASDEDIARAISGEEGDAAQVEALKTQLAQLDESILASGVENEEVKQQIKDIQAQVDRVSKLIEIENTSLAMSQERASADNDTDEAVAAIAKTEQPTTGGETNDTETGTGGTGSDITENDSSTSANNSAGDEEIVVIGQDTMATDTGSQPAAVETTEPAVTEEPKAQEPKAEQPEAKAAPAVAATSETAATKQKIAASAAKLEQQQSNDSGRQVVTTGIMDNLTGLFGSVSDYALKIVAGLVALIAALFFYRRRKSKQEFEESMLDIESGQISANSAEQVFSHLNSTSGIDLASGGDSGLELTIGTGMSYLSEEGIAGVAEEDNEVVQTGAVDPMAEADVYLAYDRDEQAIQVLNEAYEANPERSELAEKLLEIYHKQDDRQAFDALAAEFRARIGNKKSPAWTKVAIMGKEVSPDNELYDEYAEFESLSAGLDTESEKPEADVPAAKDIEMLNLEDNELDFDIPRKDDTAIRSLGEDDLELSGLDQDEEPDVDENVDTPTLSQIITAAEEEEMKAKLQEAKKQDESGEADEIEEFKFNLGDEAEEDELNLDDSDTTELAATLARLDFKETKSEEESAVEAAEQDQEDSYLSEASEQVMEPYHESETALELAKAYLELGEKDIAKGFIEEVINEGSDKQKAKAEKLVKGLLD